MNHENSTAKTNFDFLSLAKERYSLRKFSDQAVEPEKLELLLRAAQASPTAMNFQPHRLLVVNDEENLEKMRQVNRYHFHAPLYIIVGYDTQVSWKRDYDKKDEGDIDASVVGTHIMLAAASLGLGSTWVGHFDPKLIAETFHFPETIQPVCILPIGYPHPDAKPAHLHERRLEISDFAFFNQFPENYTSTPTDSTKK